MLAVVRCHIVTATSVGSVQLVLAQNSELTCPVSSSLITDNVASQESLHTGSVAGQNIDNIPQSHGNILHPQTDWVHLAQAG